MRRVLLMTIALLALTSSANAAPASHTALYRNGRAADGYLKYSGDAAQARGGSPGTYDVLLVEPSTAGAAGYAQGSGVVATPAQPGLVDGAKPWIAFTHLRADGTVLCHAMTNLTQTADARTIAPGEFALADSSEISVAIAVVACDDGIDATHKVLWLRSAPMIQLAWTFPIAGSDGPYASATIHGLTGSAAFMVCGSTSGCVGDDGGSFWRIYDGALEVTG